MDMNCCDRITFYLNTVIDFEKQKPLTFQGRPVPVYSIQFNSIQFIDQLRALKGQQENCTYMNKQYAQ